MNPRMNSLEKRKPLRPISLGTEAPRNSNQVPSSHRKPRLMPKLLLFAVVLSLMALQFATLYLLHRQKEEADRETSHKLRLEQSLAELQTVHYRKLLQDGERERKIDPKDSKLAYEMAAEFAMSANLNRSEATQAASTVPTGKQLSSDCQFEILQAKGSKPISFIDVSVINDGRFVPGLERQDFELTVGPQRLKYLSVGELDSTLAQLNIAVLLDCSSSTSGVPFVEEQNGAIEFCRTVAPHSFVRLWRFADDAQAVSSWANDAQVLTAAIQRLQSNGGTALVAALKAALADLATRSGEKAIVLFTDGKDSGGNQRPEEVLQLCSQIGVKVHCVALKTKDVDEQYLQRLSRDTNGSYVSVTEPKKLAQSFNAIAASLKRKMYRIVVIDTIEPLAQVTVQVGNLPPRTVSFKSE